ncbi:Protein HIR1 [Psilocybe cubensis]|uniref:Protein HIR1 n=2 Tax=Psilocybe cubensis TaxID=181762 RepID=A0ACB8GRD1_PSICU|nr:Protein HIR1 [Psilocybe cubensis]KAH9477977.1 Protein HIR1 [Psilocybe cubensis]
MHFTKPEWVMHKDSAKSDQHTKRLSIFSVHVHPDGSRIATGGLDAKIRIWSTKPILNPASELSGKPPKSLCTLTMHTGPVLTVRWAHSGRWLASGSDDETVMVWDHDPNARGKVWGTDDVNVEGWKPLKRLQGHESDVTDVAWSPTDRYLASVGLDSAVIIWCGYTLERLRKLDQHQGFVKGVCWDPVGEFMATQSDDRTVKIWKTTDWSLEAEVRKPFEDSPGSTFFRRLSWSPDGAHITASNATNNKGYVFIAAVITRNTWTSEISLVGHENTVEVACYNPHIFLRNPSAPISTSNICSVVALGADDRSVSVWQTKSARPLIVAKEVFERQIMDLSWSWDGMTLYAASSDGTIGAFQFDSSELEGIATHADQEQYLAKFGFVPPPLPEGYSHLSKQEPVTAPQAHQANGFVNNPSPEKVNILVAKRAPKDKKRATLVSSTGINVPTSGSAIPPGSVSAPVIRSNGSLGDGTPSNRPPMSQMHDVKSTSLAPSNFSGSSFPHPSEQTFGDSSMSSWARRAADLAHAAMELDAAPVDSFLNDQSISSISTLAKGKRKVSSVGDLADDMNPKGVKARTLGGDRPLEVHVPKPIAAWGTGPGRHPYANAGPGAWGSGSGMQEVLLPNPQLLSYVSSEVEGSGDVLEAKNIEENGTTEIALVSGKQTEWLDYLPSPALLVKATSSYCAVAMEDGTIHVYSHTGRRIMPTIALSAPCSVIEGCRNALLVMTVNGEVHSWNIKKQTANFPPTSIRTLYAASSSPNFRLVSAAVRENGAPIAHCSNGIVYSYDPSLLTWVKLADKWYADGSDFWQSRQRGNASTANRGIMTAIEGSISSPPDESAAEIPRPSWWSSALTLAHLETKLHATRLLDSPQEYKQALLVYAKKMADEGFRSKAEELVRELFGPVYWRPGKEENWNPSVAGLSKRDLLKDVLSVFARSKTLSSLAAQWQDTLKKATNDESFT